MHLHRLYPELTVEMRIQYMSYNMIKKNGGELKWGKMCLQKKTFKHPSLYILFLSSIFFPITPTDKHFYSTLFYLDCFIYFCRVSFFFKNCFTYVSICFIMDNNYKCMLKAVPFTKKIWNCYESETLPSIGWYTSFL